MLGWTGLDGNVAVCHGISCCVVCVIVCYAGDIISFGR